MKILPAEDTFPRERSGRQPGDRGDEGIHTDSLIGGGGVEQMG